MRDSRIAPAICDLVVVKTIHHELGCAIGIMDIAGPVVDIEKLGGLGHRTE